MLKNPGRRVPKKIPTSFYQYFHHFLEVSCHASQKGIDFYPSFMMVVIRLHSEVFLKMSDNGFDGGMVSEVYKAAGITGKLMLKEYLSTEILKAGIAYPGIYDRLISEVIKVF